MSLIAVQLTISRITLEGLGETSRSRLVSPRLAKSRPNVDCHYETRLVAAMLKLVDFASITIVRDHRFFRYCLSWLITCVFIFPQLELLEVKSLVILPFHHLLPFIRDFYTADSINLRRFFTIMAILD